MRKSLMGTTALAAVAFASLGVPAPAQAANSCTIYATSEVCSYTTSTSGGAGFNGQQIGVELFNTNLGNLQSVLIVENLSASFSGNAQATNGSAPTSGTMGFGSHLKVTGGPAALDGAPLVTISKSAYIPGVHTSAGTHYSVNDSFRVPVTGQKTVTVGHGLHNWRHVGSATTAIKLSSYGSKTSMTAVSTLNKPSGWDLTVNQQFTFTLDYTYNFTVPQSNPGGSVPEPASGLLLGAGLVALGAARRRVRSSPLMPGSSVLSLGTKARRGKSGKGSETC
jgi:PEP-CTERM motif